MSEYMGISLPNMKFPLRGEVCTGTNDDTNDDARRTNIDCVTFFGIMPDEPKSTESG